MTTNAKQKTLDDIKATFGRVPEWMSQVPDSALPGLWAQMRDFYLAETVIPNKYKELIGIAVAGTTHCRYCALFHTEGAKLHGATDEEIAEASMMAGVTNSASTFINAQQIDYDRFEKETREIVAFVKKQMTTKGRAERPESRVRA